MAADVILPTNAGPFPTVVLRTPYTRGRNLSNPKGWLRLVDHGYALVLVDMRGRNDSDGKWVPFVKDTHDGCDAIEWAAGQSWSTGKVGMVGGSYEGLTQWWTAIGRPRQLKCIAPFSIGGKHQALPFGTGIPLQYWIWWMHLVMGRTQQFPGGPSWEAAIAHTPLKTLDKALGLTRSAWRQYVAGDIDVFSDAATLSPEDYSRIDIPVLIAVGWWDDQGTMEAWEALQSASSAKDCRLLIGAWDHAGTFAPRPALGGLDMSESMIDTVEYVERFLAQHLKGEPGSQASRCKVFCTGEGNWESMQNWPDPQAVPTPFYLDSAGNARGLQGGGQLSREFGRDAADCFTFDPNKAMRDMSNLAVFAWADPPLDYRYLQRRDDILVYTSDTLLNQLRVSGRYRVQIWISSDRPDTDLFVALSDVHPDGRSIGLAASNEPPAALRLRFRDGPRPECLEPGRIYEVMIEGSWLHHVFQPEHRIRLTISGGNFPLAARNGGSGAHWAEDTELYPQTNTVYHSPRYASQLLLPVVSELH